MAPSKWRIYRFSGFTNTIDSYIDIDLPEISDISWISGNLYVSELETGKYYEYSGFSNTVLGSFSSPDSTPSALCTITSSIFAVGETGPGRYRTYTSGSSTHQVTFSTGDLTDLYHPSGIMWQGGEIFISTAGTEVVSIWTGVPYTTTPDRTITISGIGTGGGKKALSGDGTYLLVGDSLNDRVVQVNPTTGAVVGSTVNVGANVPNYRDLTGVAWDGSNLLVAVRMDTFDQVLDGLVLARDGEDDYASFVGFSNVVDTYIAFPGISGDSLWLAWDYYNNDLIATSANGGNYTVYRKDGVSATTLDSIVLGSSYGWKIGWDGKNLISSNASVIYRFSGFSTTVIDSFTSSVASEVIWDGMNVISLNASGFHEIYKHRGFSGSIDSSFLITPSSLDTIAFDGKDLYGYDSISNKIYRYSGISSTELDSFTPPWVPNGLTTIRRAAIAPTVDFIADDTTPLIGQTVNFTNNTTNAVSYAWTFPGGIPGSSTLSQPGVVYNVLGTYDVILKATSSDGLTTEELKADYIVASGVPPVAAFSANITTGFTPLTVDFTDESTNTPTSWSWVFENGTPSTSTAQNPTGIIFSATGAHNVTLTATNAAGSDGEVKTDYIVVSDTVESEFDGSLIVVDVADDNFDGTVRVFDTTENGFDGNLIVGSAIESEFDGLIHVIDTATSSYNGYLHVGLDREEHYDGYIYVVEIEISLFDGFIWIVNTNINEFDSTIRIYDVDTDKLNGRVRVVRHTIELFDGRLQVFATSLKNFDAHLSVVETIQIEFDGRVWVHDVDTNEFAGQIHTFKRASKLYDGKIDIFSTNPYDFNARLHVVETSQIEFDGTITVVLHKRVQFDGLFHVFTDTTEPFDGWFRVSETTSVVADMRLRVVLTDATTYDGKLYVFSVRIRWCDGFIRVFTTTQVALDSRVDVAVIDYFDGKILIEGIPETVEFFGRLRVREDEVYIDDFSYEALFKNDLLGVLPRKSSLEVS